LKLASLFSGGKDSTYALYKARSEGHEIVCLVSMFPKSEESHLLHYPNMQATLLQAESMKIPQLVSAIDSNDTQTEIHKLGHILQKAKKEFGIQGIVHGGILSNYQKNHFDDIGKVLDLKVITPLWRKDQREYLDELLKSKFRFIITSVTTGGLDDSWLGKEITSEDVKRLNGIGSQYGFNLSFEGGEAETFVIDCPLFSSPIKILKANKIWDGYRGRFEITEAILDQ
jgi:diphthine-ammonia ligase